MELKTREVPGRRTGFTCRTPDCGANEYVETTTYSNVLGGDEGDDSEESIISCHCEGCSAIFKSADKWSTTPTELPKWDTEETAGINPNLWKVTPPSSSEGEHPPFDPHRTSMKKPGQGGPYGRFG